MPSTLRSTMRRASLTLFIAAATAQLAAAAEPITTRSLLAEMTDLARLAEAPSPAYVSKQSSSHDPRSVDANDKEAWFANDDANHFQGTSQHGGRTEHVMMKADGPGAIVRIWSANPVGTIRVYIDGSDSPVIEAPMADLLGGKVSGIPAPIASELGRGFNLYLPIPYARSCEVTSDHDGFYYAVDYRTYQSGAAVRSFTHADLQNAAADVRQQASRLASPQDAGAKPDHTDAFDLQLAPGASAKIAQLDGERAITDLRVQLPQGLSETALRALVLRATFDSETTVEVPLGDFFGTAPGVNPYASLPLSVSKSAELRSRWVMPFRQSATIEVVNHGDAAVDLAGDVGSAARPWTDRSMHFNAGFRAEADHPTRPIVDWNYLTAQGRGRFVGVSFAIDSPAKEWWGEGDEKIYVDAESQPSWFGTGTEDYYSYAWGDPGLFEHAYHNQPRCDGPANYGRTSVNRFHIMDDIPFNTSLRFDMEIWHWKDCKVNLAVTTYWYAMPGGSDNYAPLTPSDLKVYPMPPYQAMHVAGAIEGESLKVIEHTGKADPQDWADLSGDRHLWWRSNAQGDHLKVEFNAPSAGRYRVKGRFLRAPDYGIAQLAINGQGTHEPIDFYNREVKPTEEIDLGTYELRAGANQLDVTEVGTNPAGKHQYLFGLDYLRLEPVGQ